MAGDGATEFRALGLSAGGTKPHAAYALFIIEMPAVLSTRAANTGRNGIFMMLPLGGTWQDVSIAFRS
jgi:hypothetical protein